MLEPARRRARTRKSSDASRRSAGASASVGDVGLDGPRLEVLRDGGRARPHDERRRRRRRRTRSSVSRSSAGATVEPAGATSSAAMPDEASARRRVADRDGDRRARPARLRLDAEHDAPPSSTGGRARLPRPDARREPFVGGVGPQIEPLAAERRRRQRARARRGSSPIVSRPSANAGELFAQARGSSGASSSPAAYHVIPKPSAGSAPSMIRRPRSHSERSSTRALVAGGARSRR